MTNQIIKQAQEKIRNSIYPLSRLSPNENINPDFLEVVLKIDKIVDQAITQAVEEERESIINDLKRRIDKKETGYLTIIDLVNERHK